MPTLIDGTRAHPRAALAITAGATCVATLGVVAAYMRMNRAHKRRELERDVKNSVHALASSSATTASLGTLVPPAPVNGVPYTSGATLEYDENLVREHLARNYAFFGEEGMASVRKSTVVVVGCGGVGSWVAVMLARSGVGTLRLIDFDYVSLSSLNRHASALAEDVGTPKVHSLTRTLSQITRALRVEPHVTLWRPDDPDSLELLDGADWVVDAIDNIGTKVELLRECSKRGIKVFASMGAGAKSDPTRVQIADLSQTTYDPLARAVRRKLRAGTPSVTEGIPVVYSTEIPSSDIGLLPLPQEEFEKGKVQELAPFDEFRVRILPVLGPLPAIFGLHIATYIVSSLAGRPIANPLPVRHRKKLYEKLLKDLVARETRIRGEKEGVRIPVTEEDAGFLTEDLHRGRSCVPPYNIPSRPVLVRWDPSAQLSLHNLALMEKVDADRHEREVLDKWKGRLILEGGIVQGQSDDTAAPPHRPTLIHVGSSSASAIPTISRAQAEAKTMLEETWGAEAVKIMEDRAHEVNQMLKWVL